MRSFPSCYLTQSANRTKGTITCLSCEKKRFLKIDNQVFRFTHVFPLYFNCTSLTAVLRKKLIPFKKVLLDLTESNRIPPNENCS